MRETEAMDSSLLRLTAASRALTYAASLEEVLEITVDAAAVLLDAERVALMLQEGPSLQVRASRGIGAEEAGRFGAALDESLVDRLTAIFGEDTRDRFLGVPLVVHGRIVGLLTALSEQRRRDERDEWLLSALADQAAVAVERSRLAASSVDLERRLAEVEAHDLRQEHALRVVRHDFQTPLGAIRGYLDLLQRGMYGPVTDRQMSALGRLWTATAHLESLIRNALEMGRLQAGEVSVRCEPVPVRTVVEEAVGLVEHRARQTRINLKAEVPEGAMAKADAARLRQVLVQLLDNSLKYSPPDTEVRVVATRAEGRPGRLTIRVSDDGPGIDPEHADAIFEPYKRFAAGTGSGLGLAIARAVTALMDGQLELESTEAPGATFALTLPAG
jgi:phosphoserine phosphatase RsbU/P